MDTSDLAEFKSIMEQGAERYRADQARIAALEAQLAASEAKCAELEGAARADEQRLRGAAECAEIGWFGCDTPEMLADTIGALRVDLAAALARAEEAETTIGALKHLIGEQTDEIARLTRERDEAERVAVWAANNVHGVMLGNRGRTEIHFWAPDGVPESVTCDGTDADIYRALREAMGASERSEER